MALCEALQAFLGAIVIRPVNKKDWQSNFKEESETMTATEDVAQWSSACPRLAHGCGFAGKMEARKT